MSLYIGRHQKLIKHMQIDIVNFIKKQTTATICCTDEHRKPYCFTVFYAWDKDQHFLIFKSSPQTKHAKLLLQFPAVAGTILPDKLNKLIVQGIQFEGEILPLNDAKANNAFTTYHKKHPMALVKPGELWIVQVQHIKMTDSTKGFGTKLIWNRE
ncbi:MAG: pyridoxamine 5'-phosphate oxidase family protein [Niabella sp.]